MNLFKVGKWQSVPEKVIQEKVKKIIFWLLIYYGTFTFTFFTRFCNIAHHYTMARDFMLVLPNLFKATEQMLVKLKKTSLILKLHANLKIISCKI